jgi:hypothetical protein
LLTIDLERIVEMVTTEHALQIDIPVELDRFWGAVRLAAVKLDGTLRRSEPRR